MPSPKARRAAIKAVLDGIVPPQAGAPDVTAFTEAASVPDGVPPRGAEEIGFLLYPGCTALDVVGPQRMLRALAGARIRLVSKTRAPVVTDIGLALEPDTSFADCPAALSAICVPGGADAMLAAMADSVLIAFLADRGRRAGWTCAVSTGSLLLGAAGLLDGHRATSHWLTRDLLARFGATPVEARVVMDRGRATASGLTAAIDLGIALVAALRDETHARAVGLLAEQAALQPLPDGPASRTPGETHDLLATTLAGFVDRTRAACTAAVRRMPR